MTSKNLCRFILGVMGLGVSMQAFATTNVVPLKPDSANAAPATVFGSPTPGVSIGKTTAPSGALDVVGDVNVTGTISGALSGASLTAGSIDSTKLATASVTKAKIASSSIDTTKLVTGSIDTGKLTCDKPDGSFGHCTTAATGTPPTCPCQ